MTTTAISVQVTATNSYPMVVEQIGPNYVFCHVPVVNDAVISAENPMPIADPYTVAIGTTTDTTWSGSGVGTLVAILKGIYSQVVGSASLLTSLGATLSGLLKFQMVDSLGVHVASVDTVGNVGVALDSTNSGYLVSIVGSVEESVTSLAALGAQTDAEWAGGSLGSVVSLLKKIASSNTGAGSYTGVTVNETDMVIIPASSATSFIDLFNCHATAKIFIAFGTAAVSSENTPGQITIVGRGRIVWDNNFIPTDAIHAIADTVGTGLTIGLK